MEIWKDIPGYEGLYEASTKGRVRTKEGKTTFTERHGKRKWKSRILKNRNPKGRDYRVSLWKNGKQKDWLAHRLVAKTFIPNPNKYKIINHIDGNPKNNKIENLEWCDYKINSNHAFDNDLMTTNKRIVLMNLKNNELLDFRSQSKASEYLGCNPGYVSNLIKKGKNPQGYEIYIRVGDYQS